MVSDDPSKNGQIVFDSSIILQYLDSIAEPRDTLYPPSSDPARITALSYEALADGVLDAAWLFRAESLRVSRHPPRGSLLTKCSISSFSCSWCNSWHHVQPESNRSEQWSNGQMNKIRRGVQALAKLPLPEFPSVQAVALAIVLWYMNRRVPDFRWEEVEGGKKLEEWFKRAVEHKSWAEEGEVPPS